MKRLRLKQYIIVIFIFVFVISLFSIAAFLEFRRSKEELLNLRKIEVTQLTDDAGFLINKSIYHSDGIVSYIISNPTLDQTTFSTYVSGLPSVEIVSHYAAIKDTTIAFSYPLEGNESGIGVDLSEIEDQRLELEKVKATRKSMLVGPVDLVEGGTSLINRMPIYIGDEYWGQLSLIIDYNKLMELAGIKEFAESNKILIEQISEVDENTRIIYQNTKTFSDAALQDTFDVPNGEWRITIESDEPTSSMTPLFVMLVLTGLILAIISAISTVYIIDVNNTLNQRVYYRTKELNVKNEELSIIIERLNNTQDQLVMREKQAAMGEMVAGVAHEINTPLGVSITSISYIENLVDKIYMKFHENKLTRTSLKEGLEAISESADIIQNNLERASQLVNSFKQLSADLHVEDQKVINLKTYMDYIIRVVSPSLRGTSHQIEMKIVGIDFLTYPGSFSQVITNLIINSLVHGFESVKNGRIYIQAEIVGCAISLDYYDNGVGIPKEIKDKVFNPFFTTKRNLGNTGLGLNIAYNIVTQQLEGDIDLVYDTEEGVHIKIVIPISEEELEVYNSLQS